MAVIKLKGGLLEDKINVALIQLESPFYHELSDASGANKKKLFFWRDIDKRRDKIIKILENINKTITDSTLFPDIIVFPEYTIPHEILDDIKDYLENYKIVIAGSDQIRDSDNERYRKNVCPVIIKDHDTFYIEKNTLSEEEIGVIEPGNKENSSLEIHWDSNVEELCLQISICLDYLENTPDKERKGGIIVPMSSPSMKEFVGLQYRDVRYNKFILLCNSISLINSKPSMLGQSAIYGAHKRREENDSIISLSSPSLGTSFEGVIFARLNFANPTYNQPTTIPPIQPVEHKAAYHITNDCELIPLPTINEEKSLKKIGVINPYLYKENIKMLCFVFMKTENYSIYKNDINSLSKMNFSSFGILGDHDVASMRFIEAGEETKLESKLKKYEYKSLSFKSTSFIHVEKIFKFYGNKTSSVSDKVAKSLLENPQIIDKLIALSKDWDTQEVTENDKKELLEKNLILGDYDIFNLREKNCLKSFICIDLKREGSLAKIFENNILKEYIFPMNSVKSIYRTTSPSWFNCDYLIVVIDTPHNIFDLILKIHLESKNQNMEVGSDTYVVVEQLSRGLFNELPIKSLKKEEKTVVDEIFNSPVQDIIKMGENEYVEFKSSLRWDYKQQRANKEIELNIAKTITAFMNTEGGILLIGVDDEENILGLDKDISTIKKKNIDGFELALGSLIRTHIGSEIHHNMKTKFEKINDKSVAKLLIRPSIKPVFLDKNNFYIRTGNASQPLNMEQSQDYINMKWKK